MEKKLANVIGVLCKIGFTPSKDEVLHLVSNYLKENNIKAAKFKDGRPGPDWLKLFMKRNKLSFKKTNTISAACKSATSNLFIIYNFYDQLDEIITQNNLTPKQIWNCDDSRFLTDPQKCKVVSVKGEVAYKVTPGACRENITTLAVCNAVGRAMDPLIIFKGKNYQSSWAGNKGLPNIFYSLSESGWVTSGIFAVWFDKFCDEVKERPLLLLFDGHLTRVSVPVIERAMEEKIFILKFPPHVTDVLQPLDVACFGLLKREWERILNLWVNESGMKQSMRKEIFVNKISEIWYNGLKESNIKNGFEATGIFPVNSAKYPEKRSDQPLITRFNLWVANGKPETDMIALATSVETPRKDPQTETPKLHNLPPKQITFNATSTPNSSFQCHCMLSIPGPPPKGICVET